MTRRSPCILVSALCCLLAVATSGCEKGPAWVLWQHASAGLYPSGEWAVLEGYRGLTECRQAAAAQAQRRRQAQLKQWGDFAAKNPKPGETPEQARANSERELNSDITVEGGYFEMKTQGGTPMVFDHVCLPDTVDPRGPKGKN
jgi:hypothetical protein